MSNEDPKFEAQTPENGNENKDVVENREQAFERLEAWAKVNGFDEKVAIWSSTTPEHLGGMWVFTCRYPPGAFVVFADNGEVRKTR